MRRFIIFAAAFIGLSTAFATPIKWTCRPPEAAARSFTMYHGETLEFQPEFIVDGAPLTNVTALSIYWQTNGMGTVWWSAPGTTFGPSNDVGAASYRFFIRAESSDGILYRANGTIRMLASPGFVPAEVELPAKVLDFSAVDYRNAPWADADDLAAATNAVLAEAKGAIGDGELYIGNTEPYRSDGTLYAPSPGGATLMVAYPPIALFTANQKEHVFADVASRDYVKQLFKRETPYALETAVAAATNYTDAAVAAKADKAALTKLTDEVNAWTDFIVGDGIRATITNYYGNLDIPSLYIEQKMEPDENHTNTWYKVVWDERARWNAFMTGDWANLYLTVTNDAAHAFGNYNSLTGRESPDGVLQISHPVIIFTDGSVSYEKCSVEVGGCTLWTVQTSGLTFDTNATSNDFFRIFDGEGKALFEVVQGTRRTVGAVGTGANFINSAFEVTYNANVKPDLKVCTNLVNAQWFALTNAPFVASHEYESVGSQHIFTITPVAGTKQMFATGSYEVGGDTYIKNHAPVSMSSIVIDGQQYGIAVETVNGKKLMVLTEE